MNIRALNVPSALFIEETRKISTGIMAHVSSATVRPRMHVMVAPAHT